MRPSSFVRALIVILAFTAGVNAMEILKFSCKIKWPWYTDRSRGNIKCLVAVNTQGIADLSSIDGVEFDDFWEFNGGTDGDLEDFVKLNGKKTKAIYKRKSTTSPFKRVAWLKLKDDKLYCFYKTRYGGRYAESFGVTDTDTGGWLHKQVSLTITANGPGLYGQDTGFFTMGYKTKAGKKSVMKLHQDGGQPRQVEDAQSATNGVFSVR